MDYLQLIAGLALLLFAGDQLVKGSVTAGLRFNISPIIIGLTIVAFGTSAPELFVTIQASIDESPGLAVGNVVGSNIANILLVLGLPALLQPMGDDSNETRRNYYIMFGVTIVGVVLLAQGILTVVQGLILIALLGAFLYDVYRKAQKARSVGDGVHFDEIDDADTSMPGWQIAGLILIGMVGLPIGADLAVTGAKNIAAGAGISDEVIGMTVIAFGTSLPELATTVMAALRGRAGVAIGNVIGSNVFNLLGILGVAALLDNITVPADIFNLNVWVMVLSALALAPFVLTRMKMTRPIGAVFIAAYVGYIALALNLDQSQDAPVGTGTVQAPGDAVFGAAPVAVE